jgi:hypothetical protein
MKGAPIATPIGIFIVLVYLGVVASGAVLKSNLRSSAFEGAFQSFIFFCSISLFLYIILAWCLFFHVEFVSLISYFSD